MIQLPASASSVSSNNFCQREASRPGCSQRHNVPTTTKSLSTDATDARSASVLRTFCGSLPTLPTESRSAPAQHAWETAHRDVSTKKVKVDIDLTEDDDDFENDLDAEMMMMIAQTTEEENSTRSCSSKTTDNWKQPHANAERNVSSTDRISMRSSHKTLVSDNKRNILETCSHTASDPGVSHCSSSYSSTGNRQTSYTNEHSFSNSNMRDVKHCVTDTDIKDVKHYSVAQHNSHDGHGSYNSSSVTAATYSMSTGSVEILLNFSVVKQIKLTTSVHAYVLTELKITRKCHVKKLC